MLMIMTVIMAVFVVMLVVMLFVMAFVVIMTKDMVMAVVLLKRLFATKFNMCFDHKVLTRKCLYRASFLNLNS